MRPKIMVFDDFFEFKICDTRRRTDDSYQYSGVDYSE
jgi:hypothetical protein